MNPFVTWRELRRAEMRARNAERRASLLEQKLEQERARHLAREDDLVDVMVTKLGRFALPSRSAPVVEETSRPIESVIISDTDPELLALIAEGERYGVPPEDVKRRLQAEREGRVSPFDGMEYIEQ